MEREAYAMNVGQTTPLDLNAPKAHSRIVRRLFIGLPVLDIYEQVTWLHMEIGT